MCMRMRYGKRMPAICANALTVGTVETFGSHFFAATFLLGASDAVSISSVKTAKRRVCDQL